MKTVGSRAQVMHKTASKTSGGLTSEDLKRNSRGEIVSKSKSALAKRTESPLLKMWRDSVKHVYKQPRYCGKFVLIKKGIPFYAAIKAEYRQRLLRSGCKKNCEKVVCRKRKKKACR